MSNYPEIAKQDRRLTILKILENAGQYRVNHYLLRDQLEALGHSVSEDQLKTDLDWLSEQDLCHQQQHGDVLIAELTNRGLDVANGRSQQHGVKRPQPE